jgi:dienelactone hydrolase
MAKQGLMRWSGWFLYLVLLICGWSDAGNAQSEQAWRYNLHPGDHLVYRYAFERETEADTQTKKREEYTTHVLVIGEHNGKLSVGFQRNRQSAELLRYSEKGKDKLAQQLPEFQKRMAVRRARFAEANELSPSGVPLEAWTVERETGSHIMMAVHELEGLPGKPVNVGDSWKGVNLLGFEFKVAAQEGINGVQCDRVEGTSADVHAHLDYWWCPATGVIAKLEFGGEYRGFAGIVREKAVFELKEVRHKESVEQWLGAPDSQLALLDALVLSDWVEVPAHGLAMALGSDDPATQGLALALMARRGIKSSMLDERTQVRIAGLAKNGPTRVKQLANLLMETKDGGENSGPASPGQCSVATPAFPRQRPGTSAQVIRSGRYAGQLYMLRIPEEYRGDRPFPVLISLSGGAGYAIDGVNSSEDTVAKTNYVVVYPQAGDLWWKSEVAERVDALLREVGSEINIDTNRIYIAGFSNGGTGALYYATLWPQRFAAVASLMGAGECMPEVADGLSAAADLPILFVHGDKDQIVPLSCSQSTYESLQKRSPRVAPEFHVLKGLEHEITLDNDDGLTLPFLEKYLRAAEPQRVSLRVDDLKFPRRYWVEILDKSNGAAEVQGQIKAKNTIELSTHNVRKLRVYLRQDLFAERGPIRIVVDKREAYRGEPDWCSPGKESKTQVFDPLMGTETGIEVAAGR